VLIPFFAFRIMVGLRNAHAGACLDRLLPDIKQRLEHNRLLLWLIFLELSAALHRDLTGWFTAEVGRQPWVVYGVLRTADAMTPFLTTRAATISLLVFCAVYSLHLRVRHFLHLPAAAGWARRRSGSLPPSAVPNRPMSVVDHPAHATPPRVTRSRENSHGHVLGAVLAVSMLLYVLLDGFDLGVGMLFGLTA
jgi:cytochrome d ubiquinol oxidase subunit I